MLNVRHHTSLADYCIVNSDPQYRLSKFERLTLTRGQELDRAIGFLAKELARFSYLDRFYDLDLHEARTAADYYGREEWLKNPTGFFTAPKSAPKVIATPIHGLRDGEIHDLEFPSAYRIQHPLVEKLRSACPENFKVFARMWKHTEIPKSTIIVIHGWGMGDQRINSLAFQTGLLYEAGLDVVQVELPYHGRRLPAGTESGTLFPSNDMARTNEAIGQSISDLRELMLYLQESGAQNVGCIGMSLGAYLGSLWSSLDDLSYCIPMVPLVSMAELAWEILSREKFFTRLKERGLTRDMVEEIFWVHSPLRHAPKVPRDRLMIIAGIGDNIVPPRQPKLLWDHWKRPSMYWFRGGHLAQLTKSDAFSEILGFLNRLGLVKL